ncbi:plasmid transfer protein TraA [Streptomyces sp. NPDC046203]|uniref:plasmid transfer protein TraA n=1 Tax=Streptomyces sp. NPDC046203 TaxID=3154602 RepID=UPI0033F06F5A
MASNSNRVHNFRQQQAEQPFGPPRPRQATPRSNQSGQSKSNKFAADAGAAIGGFIGAMGGSFAPPINLTVNTTKGGSTSLKAQTTHFMLGEPEFNSTEDIRAYCNNVRALMVQCAIELSMGAAILEARLGQAQSLPDDNIVQARLRAKNVARKLKKAADGATAAAKNSVAAYAAFQREYADLMRPRPQRPATTTPFRY